MKKLLSVFAIVALFGVFACNPKTNGPSQDEFDKLSKEIVDKDTQIAQLQDEMEMLTADMDICSMERDSLMELTTKKTGTYKPKAPTATTTTTTTTGGRGDMKGGTTTTTTTTGGRADMKKK